MMTSSPRRSIPTIDRISNLPDSILCHILSDLPTKQAAATIFLSKSWKDVWLSTLALDFDDETFTDFKSFHEFVYSTMFKLRNKKTPIHSFTLKLGNSSRFNQKQFNRMFKFVMERGCVNLDFNMNGKYYVIKIPQRILSFKTLEVLKLTNLEMRDFDQVDFPKLKTLSLDRVKFKSHEYFVKFLFGCPVLEDLHTKSIQFHGALLEKENLIALPNLVKVRFNDTHTPMSLVCKAKIFHLEKMSISSAGLPVFHNLTHLELSVHDYHYLYLYVKCTWLLGILQYFPKLQHFIIKDCGESSHTNCFNCWKRPDTAPECISSQLKTCHIKLYRGGEYEFEFVKYIMQHSKVLEKMIVTCLLNNEILHKLSSCTRGSTRCKLLFG
ncbi:F-box/LRR-repeat protein At4g14096-like [Trifolium pratense]|uniref:F-box/LRR-repeat protein At4g14096-like n=1 Tax=Trifolium pratense TaxID=57577 RepID=UPI001E6947DB|nr:F-box/LRR-repeat protein At4g14096-like [Trifolium pratense]